MSTAYAPTNITDLLTEAERLRRAWTDAGIDAAAFAEVARQHGEAADARWFLAADTAEAAYHEFVRLHPEIQEAAHRADHDDILPIDA